MSGILHLTDRQKLSTSWNLVYEHGMPCVLEITTNGGFQQGHVKSAFQPLKTYLHCPNAYGHQTWKGGDLLWGAPNHRAINALITWSWKVTWQTKTIISLMPKCLIATLLGTTVIYLDGLLTIKSLPHCLWPPNLVEWRHTLKGS